jgi:hypothetical protein
MKCAKNAILCLLLTSLYLPSCANDTTVTPVETDAASVGSETLTEAATEPEWHLTLPEVDMEGYNFRVLTLTTGSVALTTLFQPEEETGEILNIDGTGNRVSATLYGHKKVYFIIGVNKIAPDFESALWRARNIASPKNAPRLNRNTPCALKADKCYDCSSPERICNGLVVYWHTMKGNKETEVVIINQDLGY